MLTVHIYLIYMFKEDLALNNLQWLIYHKTKRNKSYQIARTRASPLDIVSFNIQDTPFSSGVSYSSSENIEYSKAGRRFETKPLFAQILMYSTTYILFLVSIDQAVNHSICSLFRLKLRISILSSALLLPINLFLMDTWNPDNKYINVTCAHAWINHNVWERACAVGFRFGTA